MLYIEESHLKEYWNTFPRIVFVCTAPFENDTSLLHFDSCPEFSTRFKQCGSHSVTGGMKKLRNIPLHLGVPSHGKVSYCAKILSSQHYCNTDLEGDVDIHRDVFVVVGGEDGNVKLFSNLQKIGSLRDGSNDATIPQMIRNSEEELSRSDAVPDDSKCSNTSELIQEISMPGHASVKAIAFAARVSSKVPSQNSVGGFEGEERGGRGGGGVGSGTRCHEREGNKNEDGSKEGIMIAVGGRLAYSLWKYSLNNVNTNMNVPLNTNKSSNRTAMSSLSSLTSGTVSQKTNQDHRILCVQCVNISAPRTSDCEVSDNCSSSSSSSSNSSSSSSSSSGGSSSSSNSSSSNTEEDEYLIVMGDSRGKATIATYIHDRRTTGA